MIDWKLVVVLTAVLAIGGVALFLHDATIAGTCVGGVIGFIMQRTLPGPGGPTARVLPVVFAGAGLAAGLALSGCAPVQLAARFCAGPEIGAAVEDGAQSLLDALEHVDGREAPGDWERLATGLLLRHGAGFLVCAIDHLLADGTAGPPGSCTRHRPARPELRGFLRWLRSRATRELSR